MKRILLSYGYYKSGHYTAVHALEEEISRRGFDFDTFNLFAGKSRTIDQLFTIYRTFAAKRVKSVPPFLIAEELLKLLIKEIPFDVELGNYDGIISTHPYASAVLAAHKAMQKRNIPLISVHTDYTPFPLYVRPGIDYYTGAFTKEDLTWQVQERCLATGIPVRTAFRYDQRPKEQKILFVAGADGFGELEKMASFAAKISPDFERIIVCGRNKTAYNRIRENYSGLTILGYIDDLSPYFQQAAMVVTKGGGLTITEALNAECIPVFTPAVLSWEDEAAKYIVSQGAGICLPDFGNASIRTLNAISKSSELKNILRERSKSLARPNAAKDIVEIIISGDTIKTSNQSPQENVFNEMKNYRKVFKVLRKSALARYLADEISQWLERYNDREENPKRRTPRGGRRW